uniref:NRF domain-containing protein n=1 Tax=Panagrellus redivivus TaxID=6233 RepID=A0A7E4V5S3_PANRE
MLAKTVAQVYDPQSFIKAINAAKNANFDELSSNGFSYKKSLPTIENIIEKLAFDAAILANLTADCSEDIELIVSETTSVFEGGAPTQLTEAVLKLIDSSGKPSAGILLGNTRFFGLFKECQAIKYDLGNRTFAGRYSEISFALGGANETTCVSSAFTIDLCLPKTCTSADIKTIVNGISKGEIVCEVQSLPREAHANAGTWITLGIIAVVLFLGVTASVFDYVVLPYHKHEPYVNSFLMQCWRSFSLYTNVVEIFNTKGANKPGNIGPIHCMRFFSMCWVVMGHSMVFFVSLSVNPLSFLEMQKYRIFGIIDNSFFSVDTFFWQSGLLLTFVWLKKYNQNKQQVMSAQAWILFYVHRIVRLSPPYFLVIAFYTWIYIPFAYKNTVFFTSGEVDPCETNWWLNFLYLNNDIRAKEQCYGVSWYLATDMRMFILTPVILIPLAIKKTYGVIVALVILAISTGINIFEMYHYYFPPTMGNLGPVDPRMTADAADYDVLMYAAPWIRCQVYIIGMLTGVLMQTYKKLRIPNIVQLLGWIMTLAIAYGCLFTLKGYFNGDVVPLGWRTLFSAASKPLWGIALSWIVVTCYYGYGSFINSFMSWSIWVPVGRLSYSTYLIHIIVVTYLIGQNQQPFVFSNFFQMFAMFIVPMIVCSLLFALFWSSAFELGFGKLETVLINALIGSKPKPMPVRPRASTLDPPVPETPPVAHDDSAHARMSISKKIATAASDLGHRQRQSVATIEIPLDDNENFCNEKSTNRDDDGRWS